MYDTYITKYDYASLTEALHRILNKKQHKKENLISYTKRFKQASEVFRSHVDPDTLY